MKKNLLCVALALVLLAGCSSKQTAEEPDPVVTDPVVTDPVVTDPPVTETPEETPEAFIPEPVGDWGRDGTRHWLPGDNGEQLEIGEHSLDVAGFCAVCGSEVWQYEGGIAVNDYSPEGALLRASSYGDDGAMICDLFYEYTEGGLLKTVKEYSPNGTHSVSEYDEQGDPVTWLFHDAEENLLTEVHYEYAVDGDGVRYMSRSTDLYADGSSSISEFNEHGEQSVWQEYDADGSLLYDERYEWEYSEEGYWVSQKVYTDGELTHLTEYATYVDEEGWYSLPKTITDYYLDGSRMISRYNEDGELTSVSVYDAEGNRKAVG